MSMNKKEYAQANKLWLATKAREEGVKPLPKGIYYKVLADGKADGKHPTTRSIVTAHYTGRTVDNIINTVKNEIIWSKIVDASTAGVDYRHL